MKENFLFGIKFIIIEEKLKAAKRMLNKSMQRNFGLDVIRSFAIIMVLIGHVIPDNTLNKSLLSIAMLFRGYGVELFFVLSGFLIGKILINLYQQGLNTSNIKNFYIRRWFRTLPLYYLVLLINIFIYKFAHQDTNIFSGFYLKYLVFIQNFDIRHMHFFNPSWSLAVEEWFYLLLPLLLVAFYKIKIKPENLYKNLIKIIIFIALARFFYVLAFNPLPDFGIRRFIPLRFDSLLIGVLFACLKINNKEIYNKFLTKKSLIINLVILAFFIFYIIKNYSFLNVFYTSILSFSFVLFVIFFEQNKFINNLSKNKFLKFFFEKTSIYAYSMYLFNLIIMFSYEALFANFYASPVLITLYFVSLYAVGAFFYKYYEKPLMDLRNKF